MDDYWGNGRLSKYSFNQPNQLNGARILIVVGSLAISGGTNLILQYAKALSNSGAKVSIGFMLGEKKDLSWYPNVGKLDIRKVQEFEKEYFDLGIATWWRSVDSILKINCHKYLYFVQSLESRFALNYKDRNNEADAAATYMIGLPVITIASWLHNLIMAQTPSKSWFIKNGIDKEIFYKKTRQDLKTNKLRVLVEGNKLVPMKAVEETINTLIKIKGLDIKYINPSRGRVNKDIKTFNKLPINEMVNIYNDTDVLVKMSRIEGMFGPPLEAFHCGATAVVSAVTGFDEYMVHNKNGLVVGVDNFAEMEAQVSRLRDDVTLLENLKSGALDTAKHWPSSNDSAKMFVSVCFSILNSQFLGLIDSEKAMSELRSISEARIFPVDFLGK